MYRDSCIYTSRTYLCGSPSHEGSGLGEGYSVVAGEVVGDDVGLLITVCMDMAEVYTYIKNKIYVYEYNVHVLSM